METVLGTLKGSAKENAEMIRSLDKDGNGLIDY